jgi:LemA protein
MSRIGAIVKRLYGDDLKYAADAGRITDEGESGKKSKLTAFREVLAKQRVVVKVAVVLVTLAVVAEAVFQFNRLTAWHTAAVARRADVDRELQRRENLIPNLVFAVSKYASYEKGVFKYVSDARETLQMIRSPETSKTQISSALEKTLSRLIALAEEYPDLKATQSIQDLIKEAANTENRIATSKGEYNKACETYNRYRTTFPGNVFALVYRYGPLTYIGLKEEVSVPAIDLNMTDGGEQARETEETEEKD